MEHDSTANRCWLAITLNVERCIMKQTRMRPLLFVFAALSLFGLVTGHAQTDPERRAAGVLFTLFETVAYARTDIPEDSMPNGQRNVDSEDNLRLPFLELIGAVRVLGPSTALDLKSKYSSVFVGAKDFVPPSGIGAVGSRKCYIGISKEVAQSNVARDFGGVPSETIDGRLVWTWTVPPSDAESAPITYYAARIEGPYLVLTNNRQDLEDVARALSSTDGAKQDSRMVVGWEALRSHQYWVCRSIRRSGIISPEASGTKYLGPNVNAMAFLADVDKREGYIRVLTSDTSMRSAPRVLPDSELNLLKPDGPGIWLATIHMSKDALGYKTLFQIFDSFGFGAIL
jgi:hypothetical protein